MVRQKKYLHLVVLDHQKVGNPCSIWTRLIRDKEWLFAKVVGIVQWKPLNVITLGQTQTDNINGMITISKLLKIWKSSFWVIIFNHLGVRKEQRDNKCAWVLIKLQWLFISIKWNVKKNSSFELKKAQIYLLKIKKKSLFLGTNW